MDLITNFTFEPRNIVGIVKSIIEPTNIKSKFPFKYFCLKLRFIIGPSYLVFIPNNKHKFETNQSTLSRLIVK